MSHPRNNPQADPPLIALIEAVLNGQADEAQFDELEQRLQTDPAARDTYASYVNLHCELGERFAVEGDIVLLEAELAKELHDEETLAGFRQAVAADSLTQRPPHSLRSRMLALATVAALALVSFLAWSYFNRTSYNSLATVRDLSGKVTIGNSAAATHARIGDVLRPGDRLQTDDEDARTVLEYADGTTVEVHVNSAVQVPAAGDVRLRLLTGSIDVDAAPQAADRPLILATDHARYVVVGKRFRIYRNEKATRLELNEGQVLLQRQNDGQVVETVVDAGNVAVEAGVRFVEISLGDWDHHNELAKNLPSLAQAVDQPIAGLLTDLQNRGMLDDSLVISGGEFGRSPIHHHTNSGRDHNGAGFCFWLAGGGVKGGISYGASDELGWVAVENRVHVHDLHATILHLLGLDHERLTYRYGGRDYRLTDVSGRVVSEILA